MPATGNANTIMFRKLVQSSVFPAHAITLTSTQNTIVAATTTKLVTGCEIEIRPLNTSTNTIANGIANRIAIATVANDRPHSVGTVTPNAKSSVESHATTFAVRWVTADAPLCKSLRTGLALELLERVDRQLDRLVVIAVELT